MKSNNQRLAEAMTKSWTFTGQDKNDLRRLRTEVEAGLGQVDGNLLDVYNAKSSPQEVYEKIRELAPPNDDCRSPRATLLDYDTRSKCKRPRLASRHR